MHLDGTQEERAYRKAIAAVAQAAQTNTRESERAARQQLTAAIAAFPENLRPALAENAKLLIKREIGAINRRAETDQAMDPGQLANRMQRANWWPDYSDDPAIANQGRQEIKNIERALQDLARVDLAKARELWRDYAPREWHRPEFLQTQQEIEATQALNLHHVIRRSR